MIASLLSVSHAHVVPDASEPVIPPGGAGRPKDCRLSIRLIETPINAGGLGMTVECGLFEEWWREEVVSLTGAGAI